MELKEKVQKAINLIRKGEKLALSMHQDGYFVGFSGGKDSQVVLELVKMAGVKYKAYYSVTTNDPPANVKFIREKYKEVVFLHPKKNFYTLISEKGLPSMNKRYCCAILKEEIGIGKTCLIGVRAEESAKRAKYNEIDIVSSRKEHSDKTRKHTIENIEMNEHKCIKGKDKLNIYPILKWTTKDVWDFIKYYNLPINPCYEDKGRVGCMVCPFAQKKEIERYERKYPKMKETILKALQKFMDKKGDRKFDTAEECYEWWKSRESVSVYKAKKRQLKLKFNIER